MPVVAPNGSRVADMKLATAGRLEIQLAEVEMPGLMSCREEYGPTKPLSGAKITGSLHATVQTAVLIETLKFLGAQIRWCSCNIFSTQDHAAAAVAEADSCKMFAWKGLTFDEYWECLNLSLDWENSSGPDMIIDDGGDATLIIHKGIEAEVEFEQKGSLPNPEKAETQEEAALIRVIVSELKRNPKRWRDMSAKIAGVSEETTTGVHRLLMMAKKKELRFPAINVNDSVTKSKFDNIYGCRHSLVDGIMRATDVMIAGKKVVICGFGDVGKGCAKAMVAAGARVFITEIDPICALQALMDGLEVVRLESVVDSADIFVTATGNRDIIMVSDMVKMKNNAIVCNIGHFDNEVDWNGITSYPNVQRVTIKPQVDRFYFPDTKRGVIILAEGRLVNLSCATGHPSFVMSCSFTNQVLAQLELWIRRGTGKYSNTVYLLPKELDEKVAALHVHAIGGQMTKLTKKQSDYIDTPVTGPYKPITYRY